MTHPRTTALALPVQFPSCDFPDLPMLPSLTLSGLFIGQLAHLPGDGTPTGMYKQPVSEAWATVDGLRGDVQADRRFHGGPDKAVHHYPAEHYARLVAHAPQAAAALRKNLPTSGWDETTVCLGDCYQVGEAVLQVT
jgi:MOSC domain-containing protein YiiM